MKVMFFAPLAILSYHFETDLELMKKHQELGDEIIVINCSGALKSTGFAGCKGFLRCQYCKSKSDQALNLLNVPKENVFTIDLKKYLHTTDYQFKDLQELKDFTYKESDIGVAVASTLVSYIREPNPNLIENKSYIQNAINTTKATYDYLEDFLDKHKPDLIYFFNGRFSMYNPLLRLAQKRHIKFFVHERAGGLKRYSLSEDTSPHDLEYIKMSIQKAADLVSDETIEKIGSPWFEARINKKDDSWYSFVIKQQRGQLPSSFDKSKKNIAVFISSEDEFECMPGWNNPLFKNQAEALEYIADQFRNETNYHFYLRVHPNLMGIENSQVDFFRNFNVPNMTFIHAKEDIDTYALINNCEKVISFGSTVGLEAAYWGKASILMGRAMYEGLNCVYIPKSKSEFSDLIKSTLPSKSRLEATKYSYWMKNWGDEFKYFQPINLSRGKFLGQNMLGNIFLMYLCYFFYLMIEIKCVLTGKLASEILVNKIKNKLQN